MVLGIPGDAYRKYFPEIAVLRNVFCIVICAIHCKVSDSFSCNINDFRIRQFDMLS